MKYLILKKSSLMRRFCFNETCVSNRLSDKGGCQSTIFNITNCCFVFLLPFHFFADILLAEGIAVNVRRFGINTICHLSMKREKRSIYAFEVVDNILCLIPF